MHYLHLGGLYAWNVFYIVAYIKNKPLQYITDLDMHVMSVFLCLLLLCDDEEDLTLRAAIYGLLLDIHIDKTDWKSALQLLDQAIRDMPCTKDRL